MSEAQFVELIHPTDPRWLLVNGELPELITSDDIFEKKLFGRPLAVEPPGGAVARYRKVVGEDSWRLQTHDFWPVSQ